MTAHYSEFTGKVALVTGAGSGIGRATALAFAASGARLVLGDINPDSLQAAEDEISASGAEVAGLVGDAGDDAYASALVSMSIERFGQLDFAFNNAAISPPPEPIELHDLEAAEEMLRVNLRGVWSALRYQIPAMRNRGGAIVNTSSHLGIRGGAGRALYSAAKHGVLGLTKSAAVENAAGGIRINAVCPGAIETGMMREATEMAHADVDFRAQLNAMQPIGRWGQPEEIASAVLWLCSDGAAFVVGQAISIDGGVSAL